MSDAGYDRNEERRRVLVQNERLKLAAANLDRLSTAYAVAGFIAPITSLSSSSSLESLTLKIGVSTAVWLLAALILHWIARQLLGKLGI
ncbi:hypothetical protein [Neorhizobium sp. JUb45]|uniref:hypothetical protein n=1 Tax=unclassified Neorhizobium TaxID=2629175 RepID=UPI0010462871|nr:hypothetical protein [Neorhizobium sp. JUb45]